MTTRNPKLLAQRAGVAVASAQAFLRKQASAQTSEQWRKPSQHSHSYAPTGAPADNYQSDVVFMSGFGGVNDKRRAILTLLNTTTRFAAARPILSAKAPAVAAGMASILDELAGQGRSVSVIRVDGGSEYKADTAALLRARGITLEKTEPYTHYRLARTDRLHRTLRKRIGEFFEREQSHRWLEALPDIIANYNETPHRTLSEVLGRPTAPADVTPRDEVVIRAAEATEAQQVSLKTDALGIVPGQSRVRLLVKYTKQGVDSYAIGQRAVWTPEIYTVLSRTGPNSWLVDVPPGSVKIWPSYAVKVVEEDTLVAPTKKGPKVDMTVERARRLEALNISSEEQAAALAAPARARSARAARVDYARLASGK